MKKLPKVSFEFSRQIFYVFYQFSKYLNFHAKIVYLTNFQIIWIFAPKMPKMRFWWWFTVFENYSKCLILQNRELILFFDENTYLNFRAKNVNLTNLQIIWIFPPKMYIWPYLTNLQKFEFSRQNCQQCT